MAAPEKIQYEISAVGVGPVTQQFEQLSGKITASDKVVTSFQAKVSGTGAVVGSLTTALSAVSPEFANLAFSVGTARSAIGGLLAALGGPAGLEVGAVAGGLIAALGFYAKSQKQAEDATKKATEEIEKQEKAIADLIETSRGFTAGGLVGGGPSAEEQTRAELTSRVREERIKRLRAGGEAPTELEAQLNQELALLNERKNNADELRAAEFDAEVQAGEDEIRLEQETTRKKQSDAAKRQAEELARQEREFSEREAAVNAHLEKLDAMQREHDEEKSARQLEREQEVASERTRIQLENLEYLFEEENRKYEEQAEEKARINEEHARAAEENRRKVQNSIIAVGDVATQSIARQFSALAKGAKFNAATVLETIGDMMVAEGTRVLFQAAVATILGTPQGPALFAVGTAEIAAGLALGAASARRGGGAPAGGGGGGGGIGVARPVVSSESSGEPQQVIFNVQMPTVVSPGPDDGLRVIQAAEESYRVHGVGLERRGF